MNRQQALKALSANRDELNRFSVKDVYLFGSVARDESIDGSDVDILVEFQADAKIGLFQFARLQRFLSELFECDVDLATPDALHKDLKENILKEAIHATAAKTSQIKRLNFSILIETALSSSPKAVLT